MASDALLTVDWDRLARDFARRETDWLSVELDRAGIERGAIENGVDSGSPDGEALRRAWAAAVPRRGDATLLAVYAYTYCQRRWELSTAYDAIKRLLAELRRTWLDVEAQAHEDERLAVGLMLEHAAHLWQCMMSENAVACSCPVALATAAEHVAGNCTDLLARSAALHADWRGFRTFLDRVLQAHQTHFTALHATAGAMLAWVDGNQATAHGMATTSERLLAVETSEEFRHDVYATELRAHRQTLETIAGRLADDGVRTVVVDRAKLIYCYPFCWRAPAGESTIAAVADALNGSALGKPRDLKLSDRWDPDLFKASVVPLPTLTVRATDRQVLPDHEVALRFGSQGNHYVRIERTIRAASLHEINQGLRRASQEMGREQIADPDGGRWHRLPQYAEQRIAEVLGLLGESERDARDQAERTHARFHAILEIRGATTLDRDGTSRPASADDLVAFAGGLLLQPVPPLASALEEWVRLKAPDPVPNLVAGTGFTTDLVVRTANTTLLFMPATANWVLIGYEEMAEFVASLGPLLITWKHVLEGKKQAALARLADRTPGTGDTGVIERRRVVELEDLRIELQTTVADVRSGLGTLRSTELCHPSSNRRFLDRLYDEAGMTRLETELDALIAELAALDEPLASYVGNLEERRRLRYDLSLQLILAVLAVASLSGVASLVNSMFVSSSQLIDPLVAAFEIALLIVFILVVILGWRRISKKMLSAK